jgi:hypothetical protein
MEGMLWIEDIVKSTPALSFLINSRVDMVNFMDPYKMIVRRSAFSSFPSALNEGENKKLKKIMQKRRRRLKKSKVNLILSYVNHTFFILNSQIGPQAFRHSHYTLRIFFLKIVKKGPIQGSICFKLVPRLLVPGPLSKV